MNLNQARENMIEQQIRPWDVLDQRVLNVLADIPREKFLDEHYRDLAYSDYQIPIGAGQTTLNPNVDGRLLQSLSIRITDSVLEIGTGCGFLTACLSRLSGKVTSVEIHPELHASAAERLQDQGYSNVTCLLQDAAKEWDADDAYHAIALTGSVETIPDFYLQKVAVNGSLFAVVGSPAEPTMEARLMTRISNTEWITESLFETHIPPLQNFAVKEEEFTF